MGDDDRGVIGTDPVQGGDDRPLVLGIQGRRGFVDKQHVGGFGQAPGNAHTLSLTAGKLRAQLTHRSVPPVRQSRHHSCQLRFLGEPINVVAGEVWVNCEKVVPDGSVAKRGLLEYHGGVAAQLAYRRRNVTEGD